MSSAGRGKKPRRARDFYPTEPWVVVEVLPELAEVLFRRIRPPFYVLDLGCGTGALGSALLDAWGEDVVVDGIDIHYGSCQAASAAGYRRVYCEDFLGGTGQFSGRYDLVIANPPYKLAQQFVEASRKIAPERFFLLRLGFMASKKRRAFHQTNRSDINVLSTRPSFTGDGKSDSCDYAWFRFSEFAEGKWKVL